MKLGMTGNRHSMSIKARALFIQFLENVKIEQAHHGDCIGADATFHDIVTGVKIHTVIHPPDIDINRAYCVGDETREEKSYLVRNHDIVDETDMLVAFPSTKTEVLRSGTWATIRYAKNKKRKIVFFFPDGSSEVFTPNP